MLFRFHHHLPRTYYDLEYPERIILWAFLEQELQDRMEEEQEKWRHLYGTEN